jgi:hypothetical protein
MRDAELSAYCTAACSMRVCASRCRLRASGVDGLGVAPSSVASAMSFWLARGGVYGSSTLKSAFMCSRSCLPTSQTRSPRAEASPAIVARRSRTSRYSSASFASSSRAWANYAVMSAAPAGGTGGRVWLRVLGCIPVSYPVCTVSMFVDGDHKALGCRVIAPNARVIRAVEPVVRGVEESPERTGSGTPEKSHSVWLCDVAGGVSPIELWYDSLLVVAMRFQIDSRWWPGRSSFAAMAVLTDEAYVAVEFYIPWGNYSPSVARSSSGCITASDGGGGSPRAAVRAARHRSVHAWCVRRLECLRRQDVEGVAAVAVPGIPSLA